MKVIIIGAGEVGFHISKRLAEESKHVVVVDQDPGALKRIIETVDVKTIEGSGCDPAILAEAGVAQADMLLAVTDSDEVNLIACGFAQTLSPDLVKLARIRKDEYTTFDGGNGLKLFGIDKAISPDEEIVLGIQRLLAFPQAEEVIEFSDGRVKLVGYRAKDCPVIGTKLSGLREAVGGVEVIIAAIVRDGELIIPQGDDSIAEGDYVYFVCGEEHITGILESLGSRARKVKSVLIIGGGGIGLRLARAIEGKYHVKLIERDDSACQDLVQHLHKTLVLRGDGRDQELLEEENIRDMDVVIALTGDEETNILTSLLAKNMGADKAVVRIDKAAYHPLVQAAGIEKTVSPRMAAVNSILKYMRQGKIISAAAIKGDEAEAIEAVASAGSDLVGKAIRDMDLPKGALILSIRRGEEIIYPSGLTVIEPGDHILVLTTREGVAALEKRLADQVEYF